MTKAEIKEQIRLIKRYISDISRDVDEGYIMDADATTTLLRVAVNDLQKAFAERLK